MVLNESYLSNRTQYVEIADVKSETLSIATGVPQGSILGPILYIIYINDFSQASQIFNFISYADDTTLLSTMSNFTNAHNDDADILINEEFPERYQIQIHGFPHAKNNSKHLFLK